MEVISLDLHRRGVSGWTSDISHYALGPGGMESSLEGVQKQVLLHKSCCGLQNNNKEGRQTALSKGISEIFNICPPVVDTF
jgi:hypothetical protein